MARRKKMLFIVNPKSGKEKMKGRLLEIVNIFSQAGYQIQIHVTQCALDARNEVIRDGGQKDLIVCSGGDGTLNEVISGMLRLKHQPVLGYIPAGSTNDFASNLKLPVQLEKAAQIAVSGEDYPIDIGEFCGTESFVYVAGFGAFTEVSYLTPQDKKNLLGHQAYVLESVKSLMSIKSYRLRVQCDDWEVEGDFIFGMVTNTISVAGFKGLVNQDVALNDGLFEVLLIRSPKNPAELGSMVSELILKEENNLILKFKTSHIRIFSEEPVDWVLDGEFGGSRTDVEIRNLCRRLTIRRAAAQIPEKSRRIRKKQVILGKKNVEI
ncbi:MAG: diacylglycerol/lipid kinase family protein [Brotaphodocola sp.]